MRGYQNTVQEVATFSTGKNARVAVSLGLWAKAFSFLELRTFLTYKFYEITNNVTLNDGTKEDFQNNYGQ